MQLENLQTNMAEEKTVNIGVFGDKGKSQLSLKSHDPFHRMQHQ